MDACSEPIGPPSCTRLIAPETYARRAGQISDLFAIEDTKDFRQLAIRQGRCRQRFVEPLDERGETVRPGVAVEQRDGDILADAGIRGFSRDPTNEFQVQVIDPFVLPEKPERKRPAEQVDRRTHERGYVDWSLDGSDLDQSHTPKSNQSANGVKRRLADGPPRYQPPITGPLSDPGASTHHL